MGLLFVVFKLIGSWSSNSAIHYATGYPNIVLCALIRSSGLLSIVGQVS